MSSKITVRPEWSCVLGAHAIYKHYGRVLELTIRVMTRRQHRRWLKNATGKWDTYTHGPLVLVFQLID